VDSGVDSPVEARPQPTKYGQVRHLELPVPDVSRPCPGRVLAGQRQTQEGAVFAGVYISHSGEACGWPPIRCPRRGVRLDGFRLHQGDARAVTRFSEIWWGCALRAGPIGEAHA